MAPATTRAGRSSCRGHSARVGGLLAALTRRRAEAVVDQSLAALPARSRRLLAARFVLAPLVGPVRLWPYRRQDILPPLWFAFAPVALAARRAMGSGPATGDHARLRAGDGRPAARRPRVRRALASRDEGARGRPRARDGAGGRDAASHANVRAARAHGLCRLPRRRPRAHAAAGDVRAGDARDGDRDAGSEAAGGVGAGARRHVRRGRRVAPRVADRAGDAPNVSGYAAGAVRGGAASACARASAARGAERRRARDRQHAAAGLGDARLCRVRRHVGQRSLRHAVHASRDLGRRRAHGQRVRRVRAQRARIRRRCRAALGVPGAGAAAARAARRWLAVP